MKSSRMITKITNPKKVVTPFVERHSRRLSGREYFLLMKRHSIKETRGTKLCSLAVHLIVRNISKLVCLMGIPTRFTK